MFSKQITSSDAFVDMPSSSQLLYFHLNMEADDDGFVSNPKRMIRMINVGDDDLKILLAKRFILGFPSGIVVIKHWNLHNAVRKDMYKETQYLEEKKTLKTKDNKVYTELRNESVTEPLHRLDKDRLGKVRLNNNAKKLKDLQNIDISKEKKVAGVPALFILDEYIDECLNHKARHVQLIGAYMDYRKATLSKKITTRYQAGEVVKRHLRSSRMLQSWDGETVNKAMNEVDKTSKDIEWTLETVYKHLTK